MPNENLQLMLKKVFEVRIAAFYDSGGVQIRINRHLVEAQGQDGIYIWKVYLIEYNNILHYTKKSSLYHVL